MNAAVPKPVEFMKLMAPTKGQRRIITLMRVGFRVLSCLSSDLAARLAVVLFTSPRRYTPPRFEQEIAQSAEDLTFDCPGHTLRAYAWGEGPIVLLVHGWEGRGAQLGRFMEPLVKAGYRVVALDGPAHGRSDGKRTHVVDFAAVLPDVVKQLGTVQAIIAHSFGAAATVLALEEGMHVEKLVLIGMPDRLLHVLGRFQFVMAIPDRVFKRLLRHLEYHFGQPPESINMAAKEPGNGSACLHIHDCDDIEVPYSEGKAVMDAWSNARHLTTAGLGHRRILKDPEVVAHAVDFITGQRTVKQPDAVVTKSALAKP